MRTMGKGFRGHPTPLCWHLQRPPTNTAKHARWLLALISPSFICSPSRHCPRPQSPTRPPLLRRRALFSTHRARANEHRRRGRTSRGCSAGHGMAHGDIVAGEKQSCLVHRGPPKIQSARAVIQFQKPVSSSLHRPKGLDAAKAAYEETGGNSKSICLYVCFCS